MKKLLLSILFLSVSIGIAQELKPPSEFLGYDLGTQFTRHHEVVDYYQYLASVAPDRMHWLRLISTVQTNEYI
jgi:hypothetical protein